MSTISKPPSIQQIQEAYDYLQGKVHTTPVLTSNLINEMTHGYKLYFKCENLQRIGAFKIRGATFALKKLIDDIGIEELIIKGVITHSSGNHAQALSLASKDLNIPCTIVMPNNSSKVKIEAVKGYGAKIVFCEASLISRKDTTDKIIKDTKAFFIPPYDHPDIICGQGTVALEFLKQMKEKGIELDAIITPVGGGGLLSGTCIATKSINKEIKVFAGEPKGADDCYQSILNKKLIPCTNPKTIADGLRISLSQLTFSIISENVDDVFIVSEEEIVQAMKIIWLRMKIIIEPSAAVPLAAILFNEEFKSKYNHLKNIGVILTGGNVELDAFFDLFSS